MNHWRNILTTAAAYATIGFASAQPTAPITRHYAPNGNFDASGTFLPGAVGFNLSDVSNRHDLDRLPGDVLGLVWVGKCNGADAQFIKTVTPFLGHPKVFGFYLMDDPDPSWLGGHPCPAGNLKAEADWLRAHAPEAKTFVMLMNLGPSHAPTYKGGYNPENTHIDLFGISPYPCRTEIGGCDYGMIDRYVDAAVEAGIPLARIVPGYQTFGGGNWIDDRGGRYALPAEQHEAAILARWASRITAPAFDYAYSWGTQRGDVALESSPALRAVLADHNMAPADPDRSGR
jgi:hypothetical protein